MSTNGTRKTATRLVALFLPAALALRDGLVAAMRRSCATGSAQTANLLFSAADDDAISRACADIAVGALQPDAAYAHRPPFEHLPRLLRVYEECGRRFRRRAGAHSARLATGRSCILRARNLDRSAYPLLQETFHCGPAAPLTRRACSTEDTLENM